VKRGGSLSFLVGTIGNVLVMEIGWTDVGSGGYILVSLTLYRNIAFDYNFCTVANYFIIKNEQ
jgi:hypothetical protein